MTSKPIFTVLVAPMVLILMLVSQSVVAEADEPSLTLLRNQTSKLLQSEAKSSDEANAEAVSALCDMYVVLRQDPRYSTSEMLRGNATKIRRRLISRATDIKNDLRRNDIEKPSNLSSQVESALATINQKQTIDDDGASSSGDAKALADANGTAGANEAGGVNAGWQLVELIERIVEPDFWDHQGGPGSIRYFAIRRVLVVRATSDVHQQIRDLLLKLPR